MSSLSKFIVGIFVCVLVGCNATNPTKTPYGNEVSVTSEQLFARAQSLYDAWTATERSQPKTLFEAKQLFKQALAMQPQNVNYQLNYYNALVQAQSLKSNPNEQVLLQQFQQLHPLVQAEVVTPAFATYIFANSKQNANANKQHLLRAIKQAPQNPQNWYRLSQVYASQNQNNMAAATAHRAKTLAPESPLYAYQFGATLGFSIEDTACVYEHKSHFKTASKYITKALKGDANNAYYLTSSARQYLHLGIPPLAFAQAKKAYAKQPSYETAMNLFYSALLNHKPDEMQQSLAFLQKHYPKAVGVESALVLWRDQDYTAIGKQLLNIGSQAELYFHLLNLDLIGNMNKQDFENILNDTDFVSDEVDYVRGVTEVTDAVFVDASVNTCEKSLRLFLVAAKKWRQGDDAGYMAGLEQVLAQKTPLLTPSLWARNIIDTIGD